MKNLNFLSKAFVIIMAMLSGGLSAFAHDFEVDGIFYYITDETNKTVEVTYQGNSYSSYSNEYYGEVNIPSSVTHDGITYSVTSIGFEAFRNCTKLTEVTIPNSITVIVSMAFTSCSGLTEVNFNAVNCASMGSSFFPVFIGCSNLNTLNIGNSVKYIPNDAFIGCSLESVTSYCETPPTCGNGAFNGSYSALLNVPKGSKEDYANADVWCNFTNINEISGVAGVETEGNAIEVARYDIHGRLLSEPTEGINIVKMSDGTTRKEMVK